MILSLPARTVLATALMGLICTSCATRAAHLTYEDLLAHMTDLDRLPVIEPGVYCRQFSSYDRNSKYDPATGTYINWDANGDRGQYLRVDPETNEGVMAEMEGPGCIFRIWSANPQGVIRFYLDGDTTPTYEWDFMKLTTGEIEPFIKPLVWKRDPNNRNSASNIYLPIPFARSCKVTSVVIEENGSTKTPGHYYIIDYRVFPRGWKVESFKLPLSESQREAVRQTAQKWADCGTVDLHPLDRFAINRLAVPPGESRVAAEIAGPAVIRQFRAKLNSTEKWATRKVLLKVYWDGQQSPAVCCPIGDFFGEPNDVNYKSYPMGITDYSNYCFFPMPFHESAQVVIANEGSQPAPVETTIAYRQEDVPDTWGLFHAKWRTEVASSSFDYPLIDARGTGKLVGICLFPDNIHGGWWGEGDEKVYVDGEKFPSWFGTGSEDYFGDAWGIRCFHNPSHGFPQSNVERLQGCYRWHLGDNIPFYKSFRMTIENYKGLPGVKTRNDYSSVAYWYQLPGGSDFFEETPVADRIPRGYVAGGAIEAEQFLDADDLKSGMSIICDDGLPQPLSSSRGVKLTGKIGDEFTLKVPADLDEVHVLRLVQARDVKASGYDILVNGKKVGERVRLKKGLNPLTIRFTGDPVEGDRCELVVDHFLLEVYRNMITDWMVIGPFPNPDRKGFDAAYPPETGIALAGQYKGRQDKPVRWQRVTRLDGIVMLNDLFKPKEHLVVYGACTVNSPRASKRTLLLGSDDGVKVWLNGKLVWKNFVQRGLTPDADRVEVELEKGPNALLIKVEQHLGDVGWAVRFADPDDELTYNLPE